MDEHIPPIRHSLRWGDIIRLSTRIFMVKPMRTFLTILGTSIGIAAVVFLISLGYGLQFVLLGKLITTQDSLVTMEATYPDGSNNVLTQDSIGAVAKVANVTEVSPVAEFPGEIDVSGSPGLTVIRMADDNYFRLSGVLPDVGKEFTGDNPGVILSSQAAKLINIPADASSLNKPITVKIYYQNVDGTSKEVDLTQPLPLAGFINDPNEPPLAIVPVKSLPEPPPTFKSFLVKAKDINTINGVKDDLTNQGFIISARLDLVNQAQKVLNVITLILGVFGVTALTVSAIGMFNTMIVSFMERTYEVGVMKSLGAMDSDVRNLFLMESLIMGLAGGVIGVLLGMFGGFICNLILNIVASRLGGKGFNLFITPIWFIALVIGTSALIGLVSGFWPARRASGLSPKEAFLRK